MRVFVGNRLPSRVSPIPAVTKTIVGIFDIIAGGERERKLPGLEQRPKDRGVFFLTIPTPPSSFLPPTPPHYPISLFCSPHRCVFLEASEPVCLIEASQVYGRAEEKLLSTPLPAISPVAVTMRLTCLLKQAHSHKWK